MISPFSSPKAKHLKKYARLILFILWVHSLNFVNNFYKTSLWLKQLRDPKKICETLVEYFFRFFSYLSVKQKYVRGGRIIYFSLHFLLLNTCGGKKKCFEDKWAFLLQQWPLFPSLSSLHLTHLSTKVWVILKTIRFSKNTPTHNPKQNLYLDISITFA